MKHTALHWLWYQIIAIKFLLWRPRHLFHDLDKQIIRIMYTNVNSKELQEIHRNNNSHHIRKGENPGYITKKRAIDMFIDWECARYSKPDKPLNAMETLLKFYPEYAKVLTPYFNEFYTK